VVGGFLNGTNRAPEVRSANRLRINIKALANSQLNHTQRQIQARLMSLQRGLQLAHNLLPPRSPPQLLGDFVPLVHIDASVNIIDDTCAIRDDAVDL